MVLWMSFRRKPRTMELITYEELGEKPSGMQQYRNILDEELLGQLDQDWHELNDYLGAACWQLENGTPLWQQLHQQITPDAIRQLATAPIFRTKHLQADGEYSGFWAGEYFFAVRQPGTKQAADNPFPAVQISWREMIKISAVISSISLKVNRANQDSRCVFVLAKVQTATCLTVLMPTICNVR